MHRVQMLYHALPLAIFDRMRQGYALAKQVCRCAGGLRLQPRQGGSIDRFYGGYWRFPVYGSFVHSLA